MKRSKNGFTLIELLVVITIMSILTIITVSQFVTARMRARDVAVKGDLGALSKALQMYYADYGKFPATIGSGGLDSVWLNEFKGPDNYSYMKVLPHTKTNIPYCYVVDDAANPKKFGLFAMLENTKDTDCHMSGAVGAYSQCSGGNKYCYYIVSPNAIVSDF